MSAYDQSRLNITATLRGRCQAINTHAGQGVVCADRLLCFGAERDLEPLSVHDGGAPNEAPIAPKTPG